MKNYIRENYKVIIAATLLLVCTVILIGSNEIIAKMLPDTTELECISCISREGDEFEYTGNAVEPEFAKIVFKDADGEAVIVEKGDYEILSYSDNVEIGYADMELAIEGYRGTIVFEDAFQIVLGEVKGLQITNATKENIDLSWEKVCGADGYVVYRSVYNDDAFAEIQKLEGADSLTYQDLDIALNSTYFYKVCAYMNTDSEPVLAKSSECVEQTTPLAVPTLAAVEKANSKSIKVSWNLVDGAVGYQVYRSTEEAGEYECIGEVTDRTVNSFTDKNCSLGVKYFYYILACQEIDDQKIYGEPSEILSGNTTPDKVSLSGSTNKEKTSATLRWKAVDGATGYEIYKSAGSSSNFKLVKKIEDTKTLSWSDSGLTEDSEYYYRVRAYAVINGNTFTGSYSSSYVKEAKVNYNYAPVTSADLSGVTDYVGTSYIPGGYAPSGWDCSGFTQWAMKNYFGVSIPKSAASQGNGGTTVSKNNRSAWQPGDILCYTNGSGRVSHVALYLGDGQLMHALSSKYDTIIQNVDYYEEWDGGTRLVSVKRYH